MPVPAVGVGIGIHSGDVQIGEFSSFRSDFTAIGGVVNLAARLEFQATAGEILVSAETAAQDPDLTAGAEARPLTLKGIEQQVQARVLARADLRILIPMVDGQRSINVAVSAAMIVGEAMRQTAWD